VAGLITDHVAGLTGWTIGVEVSGADRTRDARTA
jgi:hypothetical protein